MKKFSAKMSTNLTPNGFSRTKPCRKVLAGDLSVEEQRCALEDLVASYSNEKSSGLLIHSSVAKIAVVTQVAMLLRRFDVELAEPGPFPRMEEGKPVLGIMSNKEGDDPLITLRKRSTAF